MSKNVLILITLVILAVGLFFSRSLFNQASPPADHQEELKAVINRDKDVLSGASGASEEAMAASLKRLSFSSREDVIPFVQKYESNASVLVRAAAVEAAGAMNDPKLTELLAHKLSDPEELVRIAALKGLTRNQSPEHETIIKNHIAKSKLSKAEDVWSHYALARVSQDQKVRSENLGETIKKLDVANLGGTREGDTAEVANQILNVFQGDEQAVQFAREILQKSKNADLVNHSVQFLAAYDKAWLSEHCPADMKCPK